MNDGFGRQGKQDVLDETVGPYAKRQEGPTGRAMHADLLETQMQVINSHWDAGHTYQGWTKNVPSYTIPDYLCCPLALEVIRCEVWRKAARRLRLGLRFPDHSVTIDFEIKC